MTSDCESQYENTCRGEFLAIHRKLDRLDEAIRGNGRAGIQTRLGRLEQVRLSRSRLLWLTLGAVGAGATTAIAMMIAG